MNLFKNIKNKLIIQSMLPLFVLELILNIRLQCKENIVDFLISNATIIITIVAMMVVIIYDCIVLYEFRQYKSVAGNLPQKISDLSEEGSAGLSFFFTYILPISLDTIDDWRKLITFAIVVYLIIKLMSKTNFYYANPVLAILGYRVYRIKFDNEEEYIIITMDKLSNYNYISMNAIEPIDNVYFAKITEEHE